LTVVETSSPTSVPEVHWTDELLKLLVSTWSEFQHDFEKPKCKKSKLWGTIAEKMKQKVPEVPLTGAEADRKWRNLLQTLGKVNDNKKKTGRGAVNWKYYDLMVSATKDRASVQPSQRLVNRVNN